LSPSLLKYVLANRVLGARGDKLPSLLLDLRAGRRKTEAGAMYGAVARAAETLGMRAPANAAISRIVAGIAAGTIDWSLFRGNPAALKGAVDL
ncbi:MAG TPA: ketopantoate reductase C-terminal domain-containing protein, partial [Candidatus Eremiobacteraceae bacterium]|nr:ketopantoate reductase C-terminal domain-containing protein [Candidatus Eremiobacteraceae bacterium]